MCTVGKISLDLKMLLVKSFDPSANAFSFHKDIFAQ